jgi:hypothetical protein
MIKFLLKIFIIKIYIYIYIYMSNFAERRKVFENPNQSTDTRVPNPRRSPPSPDPIVRTEIRSPPPQVLEEIKSRQGKPVDRTHRLHVFSSSQDELSKLKADIITLTTIFQETQEMLLSMYDRLSILERSQSARVPPSPSHNPSHNPSQPNVPPPASFHNASHQDQKLFGGSLEEKYLKYKSKYNKLKNKLI